MFENEFYQFLFLYKLRNHYIDTRGDFPSTKAMIILDKVLINKVLIDFGSFLTVRLHQSLLGEIPTSNVVKLGYVAHIILYMVRYVNNNKYKLKKIDIPNINTKSIAYAKKIFETIKFKVFNHIICSNKTSIKHI